MSENNEVVNCAKEQPQPKTSRAKHQAIVQAQNIVAMVAALNVDYDRLEELRDEKESLFAHAPRMRHL